VRRARPLKSPARAADPQGDPPRAGIPPSRRGLP